MVESEREAFKAAMEQVQRRVPKGHKLVHVRWSDGVLQFTTMPLKGEPEPTGWQTFTPDPEPKPRARGIVQAELEL